MIRFKKISIKNFLSFGNKPVVIELDKSGSTLIDGKNNDLGADGDSANGVGKSSMMQAIIYAIYGKGLDKLKSDEFINLVNEKGLSVELDFSVSGVDYRIVRQRKPNAVELYKGDQSITMDSMANTDKAIIELMFNIPHHIFVGVVALTPHLEQFMTMGTADQRNFIESMLSLDVLAKRAEKLKLLRKERQIDLKIAEEKLLLTQSSNEKIMKQIDGLVSQEENWKNNNENQIATIESQIQSIVTYDIDEINEQLNEVDLINDQCEKLHQTLMTLSVANTESAEISKIESIISTLGDLTESLKNAEITGKRSIFEIELMLNDLKQTYKSTDYVHEQILKQTEIKKQMSSLQKEKNEDIYKLKELERKLKSLTDQLSAITIETETLASGVCPYCSQSHFDKEKVDANLSLLDNLEVQELSIKQSIVELKNKIEIIEKSIDSSVICDFNWENVLASFNQLEYKLQLQSDTYNKTINEYTNKIKKICGDESPQNYIDMLTKKLNALIEQKKQNNEKLSLLKKDYDDLKTKRSKCVAGLTFKSLSDYHLYTSNEDKLKQTLENLKNQENPYTSKIDLLANNVVDDSVVIKERDDLINVEKHIGYLIKLLTDPKSFIRKNILEQYIPFVNKKMLEGCQELGLGHVCKINTDLSVELLYMNRPVSYYNLSQGERLRLNLAVSSAFRYLMGMLGKSCNIVLVDEYLDSALDKDGMRRAFGFIKKQADSVWIISHKDELKGNTDRTMTVTKQNGFSTIKWA